MMAAMGEDGYRQPTKSGDGGSRARHANFDVAYALKYPSAAISSILRSSPAS